MRTLKITLAYDGSDFFGWQVQPGKPTVQAALAEALERVTGASGVELPQGSGRTDAGVHALGQVATVRTASPIPAGNMVIALNDTLPKSVRVLRVEEVAEDFHARRSAKAKTYRYRVWRAGICPPFLARYVTHHPYPLDEQAMAEAARLVVGEHDFTSFAAVDAEKGKDDAERSNVRTVFASEFRREGEELIYEIRGTGFLHHMVRNLVGTFLLVGKGTLKPADLKTILEKRSRSAAGATAPAEGLSLISVEY
ncbi:MAG: tRNA pseudouridine(38-40) synthase TruA [Candidatus Koribacter versatilis]|uniref:tRNA pseudouridine synthase A n=1 Tax=Candidatus Korobacter versatilis TaxID=658062 RepID=A0A932A6T4_9BACT|nr:tRNA pseudouridine(38-40) synthase TruA [Candidatus Koribacter versatilis]